MTLRIGGFATLIQVFDMPTSLAFYRDTPIRPSTSVAKTSMRPTLSFVPVGLRPEIRSSPITV